jgi:SmpA / OmlA family
MKKRRMIAFGLIFAVIFLFSACFKPESKVTRENYEQLTVGMSYASVLEILGAPMDSGAQFALQYHTWADGDRHIHAKFLAGYAVYFSSKGLEDAEKTH